MDFDHITYEKLGDVAFIRFNDPARLNAASQPMFRDLARALAHAETEVRAIVLGGHGAAFCSGANLSSGEIDLADPARDVGVSLEEIINPLILQIRALKLPLITAVRGAAAGVGAAFALAGDLVVAGESAYFFQAFCKIGLVPDGGNSYFLVHAVGRVRAMELMLLGERLPAAKAHDWGLVNRVVADADVDATALALAGQLARGPQSLGLIRQLGWAAVDNSLEAQLGLERYYQAQVSRSQDFVEGVTAFLEKRPPQFKGR